MGITINQSNGAGDSERNEFLQPLLHLLPSGEASLESVRFSKKRTLFKEGDKADSLWVLKEGNVKLIRQTQGGKFLTLEIVCPGEVFGRSILARIPNYRATAIAISDGDAVKIPGAMIHQWMRESPDTAEAAAAILNEQSERAEWMRALGQNTVKQRAMDILRDLSQRLGEKIPVTNQDLADLAGARVETMIRALSVLRREGRIVKERGTIQLKGAWHKTRAEQKNLQ